MNQARTTKLLYPADITDLYSTYSAVDGCPQYLDSPNQATDCYVIIDRVLELPAGFEPTSRAWKAQPSPRRMAAYSYRYLENSYIATAAAEATLSERITPRCGI